MNQSIIKAIKKYNSFLVVCHVNPDPDALCSQLAMGEFLKGIGKKVTMLGEEDVPERLRFFPNARDVKTYKPKKKYDFDAVVVLDCGDLDRIGLIKDCLTPDAVIINIDHHITNPFFGRYNLVDVNASSTAEILFELFQAARQPLTVSMAYNLYAGIMTDTGSFRYENATAKTFAIAAQLRCFDFSAYELYSRVYESIPLSDIQMFVRVLNTFKILENGKILYLNLKKTLVSKFSKEFDLRDTIFKFLRSIKGVDVIVIFTEVSSKETRVNFRSSGKVNVARVANQFNGGGHKNASGGKVEKSLLAAQREVLKVLKGKM